MASAPLAYTRVPQSPAKPKRRRGPGWVRHDRLSVEHLSAIAALVKAMDISMTRRYWLTDYQYRLVGRELQIRLELEL